MAIGRHLVADFYYCEAAFLDDAAALEREMVAAARTAGCEVRQASFCHFVPYGVSGAVIIAESHLSVHTYPELGFAALDFFTCGRLVDPRVICELLVEAFKPKVVATELVVRGQHITLEGTSPE
ncbi:MAG: adenosylmethionine decarboxylase [Patescibacteria group bacterium]